MQFATGGVATIATGGRAEVRAGELLGGTERGLGSSRRNVKLSRRNYARFIKPRLGSLLRSFAAKRCAAANDVLSPLSRPYRPALVARARPKETILPLSSASSPRPLLKQWRCNFYEETSGSRSVETVEKERERERGKREREESSRLRRDEKKRHDGCTAAREEKLRVEGMKGRSTLIV